MEAVCGGKSWDVAIAYEDGEPVGVMPYHYGRKYGLTYILQPQLTQYSGPVYLYPEGLSECQRLEFEKQVAKELLSQVEALKPSVFIQHFSPGITNWLPFYWAGYSQSTRYTYRIDNITDLDRVFGSFDSEKRQRKIRRYKNCTTVRFDMQPSDFATFHASYWNGKGKTDLISTEMIVRVCDEAVARGNGVIASLHDEQEQLLAARFVAYDSRCAYALMSAVDNNLHRSGHNETLIWALLNYLKDKTRSFDFEGSMDEGIEYFYRSFGTTQVPFFQITKFSPPLLRFLFRHSII